MYQIQGSTTAQMTVQNVRLSISRIILRTEPIRSSVAIFALALIFWSGLASAMDVEFQDVATAAGLEYMGPSFGASWGDYDHDGRPDLFMSNHATPSRVFHNLWPEGFVDVSNTVEGYLNGDIHGAAWADMDSDGDGDLLIQVGAAGGSGYDPNRLLINSNGGFVESAQALGLDQAAGRGRTPLWLDWNDDRMLDAVFSNLPRSDGQAPTSIFTQTDGVFIDDNTSLGFDSDLANTFSQLMYVSGYPKPIVLVHSKWPFPDRVYDTNTVPFSNVQQDIGLLSVSAVEDFVTGDFDGDLETEIYLARLDTPSAVAQTDTNEVRAKIKGSAGTVLGFSLETQGVLSFVFGPSWDIQISELFIGSSGYQPSSLSFTLDPADSSTWGDPLQPPVIEGVRIFFDTAAQRWYVIVEGSLSFNILVASSDIVSNMETIGFVSGAGAKPDYLLDRVGGAYENVGMVSDVGVSRFCRSVVAADFDNDMDLDIYLVCVDATHNLPNVLLENDGTGHFTEVIGAAGAVGSTKGMGDTATVADYNSDGFMDILVTNGADELPLNLDGPTEFFHNTGNTNHWLSIALSGVFSNADGIGAVVFVDAGGTRQVRFQGGGMHRYSQDHSRLHFGLANNLVADQIEIHWPSGLVEQIPNVPADMVYRITEGDGVLSATELPEIHLGTVLHRSVPNPFNPKTSIAFDLPRQTSVSLRIYDVSGRLVRSLLDGEMLEQGRYEEIWNGKGNMGKQVSAGVYYYRLDAGSFTQTRSMVLVK